MLGRAPAPHRLLSVEYLFLIPVVEFATRGGQIADQSCRFLFSALILALHLSFRTSQLQADFGNVSFIASQFFREIPVRRLQGSELYVQLRRGVLGFGNPSRQLLFFRPGTLKLRFQILDFSFACLLLLPRPVGVSRKNLNFLLIIPFGGVNISTSRSKVSNIGIVVQHNW